jgi:hypothetical protein
MDAFKFIFAAKRLRAVPERHLGFLVASGHCCNELIILMPYIIFEHELKDANAVETAFILTRKFTVDRILVSKIVEYDELCAKYFKRADRSGDSLLLELSQKYAPIAETIKSAKWAHTLRNKISFHYDPRHALSALDNLNDNHPLELTAGILKGITLFDFAEEIVARPIFETAGDGDVGRGMDAADLFVREMVSSITRFHAHATQRMFATFGMVSERVKGELRERYCGVPGKLRIPLSPSLAYLEARAKKKGKSDGAR